MGATTKYGKRTLLKSSLSSEVKALKKMNPKWGARKIVRYLKVEKNITAKIRDVEALFENGKKQDSRLSAALPPLNKEVFCEKKTSALYMGWFNW